MTLIPPETIEILSAIRSPTMRGEGRMNEVQRKFSSSSRGREVVPASAGPPGNCKRTKSQSGRRRHKLRLERTLVMGDREL